MECPHSDTECHDCFEARHAAEHPERVTGCLACKLNGTIQISPKATPSKRSSAAPQRTDSNAWERGIATDERGMPFLGKGAAPIGLKEYGERRSEIEDWQRRLKSDPTVFSEPRS